MKTLDFKNLPNGTLIERRHEWEPSKYTWLLGRMGEADLQHYHYRLATDVWHFNDGSMVLPSGLVIKNKGFSIDNEYGIANIASRKSKYVVQDSKKLDPIVFCAFKVLGATEELREAGESLGYQVINV